MKKIGIITLNGYFNYGNRLQNYALEEILRKKGFEVETILVKHTSGTSFLNKIKLKVFNTIKYNHSRLKKIRTNKFKEFSRKFINESNYYIEENGQIDDIKAFDYFITGSDQVWNPYYNGNSSVYFLRFAPKGKRISYAASFGISKLPSAVITNYKEWLSEIDYLSVREEDGAKMVKELTGRNAQVVLDPTLLLTKEQWLSISKASNQKPRKNYLLTYFLGDVSEERKIKIKQIAEERGLEIVHLANINDKKAYISDPSEFIDYINSADIFLTDSFHGCVFSILLEKPFSVFEREGSFSMSSRIETLLNTFNLLDRKWENINNIDAIYDVDFTHVTQILNQERKKSLEFLENAIK